MAVTIGLAATPAQSQDLRWVRQFGTAGFDAVYGVSVTPRGSFYVVGIVSGPLPGQHYRGKSDAFIRKYAANGAVRWTHQFGTAGYDTATAVFANAGGVYVVGKVSGALPHQARQGGEDAYVRKYSPAGHVVWTRQFGTEAADEGGGVAADGTGVYVSGLTFGSFPGQSLAGNADAFLAKFDVDGNVLWTTEFGTVGFDSGSALSVDGSGVVIVGYVGGLYGGSLPGQLSAGDQDTYARQYDPSGEIVWTDQFGTKKQDDATAVSVSSTGVFVAGGTAGAFPGFTRKGAADGFLMQLGLDGSSGWTRQFGTPDRDGAWAIAATNSKVFVAGETFGTFRSGTSHGSGDAFVRAWKSTGKALWTRQFGTVASDTSTLDGAFAISTGPGGLLTGGAIWGAMRKQVGQGERDAFIVKLS